MTAVAVVPNTPTTTLSNPYAGATGVTYTFSGFTMDGSELSNRVDIAFPAGTDLSAASVDPAQGTSSASGTTLQCTLNPQLAKGSAITIRILNVTNPALPANGLTATLSFYVAKNWRGPFLLETPIQTSGAFNVFPPYAMTLSTSALHFVLEPEVPALPQSVTITVDSGYPYTITRTITGQHAEMGLQVSGDASGTGGPGTIVYVDNFTADVPWTTAGESSLTANISYTILP